MFSFTKSSKQAKAERLAKEVEQQSASNDIGTMRKWWSSKSMTEQSIIIGILAAAISSPFIIMYATKLTVVQVTAGAVNASGTHATFAMTKVAAPLWHKILFSTFAISAVGISSTILAASFNGQSVDQIIKENV